MQQFLVTPEVFAIITRDRQMVSLRATFRHVHETEDGRILIGIPRGHKTARAETVEIIGDRSYVDCTEYVDALAQGECVDAEDDGTGWDPCDWGAIETRLESEKNPECYVDGYVAPEYVDDCSEN